MLRFLFLALIISGLWACSKEEKSAEQKANLDTTKVISTNNQIMGVARIEPEEGISQITAGTSGKVLAMLMSDNQLVAKGQALVRVEVAIEQAQLGQAQSKIATQEAAVDANKATIEALKVSYANAQQNYQRNYQLFAGKAQTQENLDNSKATADRLNKDIVNAEANLKQATARLRELEADIAYYETALAQKSIKAAQSGKVLKTLVKTGEFVNASTAIAEFAPSGPLIAKTEIDELFAEKVNVGQKATIVSQSTGKKIAEGVVSYTANYLKAKSLFKDQSTEQEDRRVREVHIRLNAGQQPLIGSRVDCIIFLTPQ